MLLIAKNVPLHPYKHDVTIDVRLKPGELIWLHGTNGSGKSTVLKALSGFLPSSELILKSQRSILLSDNPLKMEGLEVRHQLNYYQMVFDTVGSGAKWMKDLLSLPINALSKGQLQRLHLAQLLYTTADIWLLDEPYNGLDREGISDLNKMITKHTNQGGSVLYSAHHNYLGCSRTICLP